MDRRERGKDGEWLLDGQKRKREGRGVVVRWTEEKEGKMGSGC